MVLKNPLKSFFVGFWTPFLKFRLDILRIKIVFQSGSLKRRGVLVSVEQEVGNKLYLLGRLKAIDQK
jgi:hypothetical protein